MAAEEAATTYQNSGTGTSDAGDQAEQKYFSDEIQIHVTALDEVVSVNSFFTAAVFIGLSVSHQQSLVSSGAGDPCDISTAVLRQLVLFEVIAFSCFLMSSLIAQGLKLQLAICNAKRDLNRQGSVMVTISSRIIRLGMMATALGTIGGTIFLMLSIINVIQLRLGSLTCHSMWSKLAVIPLVVLVSTGVFVFISTVLYSFLK